MPIYVYGGNSISKVGLSERRKWVDFSEDTALRLSFSWQYASLFFMLCEVSWISRSPLLALLARYVYFTRSLPTSIYSSLVLKVSYLLHSTSNHG